MLSLETGNDKYLREFSFPRSKKSSGSRT